MTPTTRLTLRLLALALLAALAAFLIGCGGSDEPLDPPAPAASAPGIQPVDCITHPEHCT